MAQQIIQNPLTKREQAAAGHIGAYFKQHNRMPTQKQIAAMMGIKPSSVGGLLDRLRDKP